MDKDKRAEIIQAVEWHDRDLLAEIADLTRQLAEAREQLEVCHRLSDTFWDALKPLGLKEIYLSCPGQHVVDLIRERDKAREEIARMRKALEGLYDHTKNDMQIAGLNVAAKEALEASDG